MTMEQITFSLRSSVFSVLKTLCVKANQGDLDLIFHIDPTIPDQLVGDPLRLRQVITNLIGNAVKFTSGRKEDGVDLKGSVALSCRPRGYRENSVELLFCVSDTGIGIEQENLGVIFDTFAQADGSVTRKYGGTGLGLTISKRLVNLMSGQLWVESVYQQGSRFYFTTIADLSTISVDQTIERLHPWAGQYILFIDTLNDTHGVADMLKTLNLKVIVIKSVDEVWSLQKGSSGFPDIATMIVSSLTAAEKLREVQHLRFIPIVLLVPSDIPPSSNNQTFLNLTEDERKILALPLESEQTLPPIPVNACLENTINTYYTTPLTLQEFANAIVPALESHQISPGDIHTDMELSILLAEDNKVNQALAVKLLEVAGHRIEVADNGEIALEKYK